MTTITVAEALRDSLVQLRIMHIDSDQVSASHASGSHHIQMCTACTLQYPQVHV
jgi:hypothetical protein